MIKKEDKKTLFFFCYAYIILRQSDGWDIRKITRWRRLIERKRKKEETGRKKKKNLEGRTERCRKKGGEK